MEPAACSDCGWSSPSPCFPCCCSAVPYSTTWPGTQGDPLPAPWTVAPGPQFDGGLSLSGDGALYAIGAVSDILGSQYPLGSCCGGSCFTMEMVAPDNNTIWIMGFGDGTDPLAGGLWGIQGFGPNLQALNASGVVAWDGGGVPQYNDGDTIALTICEGVLSLVVNSATIETCTPPTFSAPASLSTAVLISVVTGLPARLFNGLTINCSCSASWVELWAYPAGPVGADWITFGGTFLSDGAGAATSVGGTGSGTMARILDATGSDSLEGGWIAARNLTTDGTLAAGFAVFDTGDFGNSCLLAWNPGTVEWDVNGVGTGVVATTISAVISWLSNGWVLAINGIVITSGVFASPPLVGPLGVVLVLPDGGPGVSTSCGPIVTGCVSCGWTEPWAYVPGVVPSPPWDSFGDPLEADGAGNATNNVPNGSAGYRHLHGATSSVHVPVVLVDPTDPLYVSLYDLAGAGYVGARWNATSWHIADSANGIDIDTLLVDTTVTVSIEWDATDWRVTIDGAADSASISHTFLAPMADEVLLLELNGDGAGDQLVGEVSADCDGATFCGFVEPWAYAAGNLPAPWLNIGSPCEADGAGNATNPVGTGLSWRPLDATTNRLRFPIEVVDTAQVQVVTLYVGGALTTDWIALKWDTGTQTWHVLDDTGPGSDDTDTGVATLAVDAEFVWDGVDYRITVDGVATIGVAEVDLTNNNYVSPQLTGNGIGDVLIGTMTTECLTPPPI